MFHLIYTSHSKIAFSEDELLQLLKVVRDRNKNLGVTGMLLYANRKFIQALEGEEAVVRDLFEKIRTDERHQHVVQVMEGKSDERIFKNWSMGFKNLTHKDFSEIKGFVGIENFFLHHHHLEDESLAITFLELFYKKNWVDFPEYSL